MQLCQIHFYQKIARKKVARVNAAYTISSTASIRVLEASEQKKKNVNYTKTINELTDVVNFR